MHTTFKSLFSVQIKTMDSLSLFCSQEFANVSQVPLEFQWTKPFSKPYDVPAAVHIWWDSKQHCNKNKGGKPESLKDNGFVRLILKVLK